MPLAHLIYTSAAHPADLGLNEFAAILKSSRRNNALLEVTGVLLFHQGSFFQVLEGEKNVIHALYARIALDKRHMQLRKLIAEEIDTRTFAQWSMGHADIQAKDVERIAGLNDFFTAGRSYADLEAGRAKTRVQGFKQGQWRTQVK